MEKEVKGYEKLLSNIEEYGLHVVHVLEDDKGPGFTYSIGLFHNYQHPEIIMIGLKKDLAHILINNIGFDLKEGRIYKGGTFYSDILDDYECLMIDVDAKYYDEYVGQAIRFYKNNNFPLLQCVYPTVKGVYPWEDSWPEDIRHLQPILGDIDKENRNIS
ncbi:DUF4262 domain-containing protein [Desertivirga brevis]|uniref:DUF4262 domain-containing protein n=1 Tax=Desertivirga brevis TaxID=2810310 RepID=UPI001A95E74F|nr:DUF4262 domain-containing protein [Pedobacter sp. SYSU D00873]